MGTLFFAVVLLSGQLCLGYIIQNTTELLSNMLLPSEEHTIVTRDGYILTMFRIPRKGATPVLFVHGFLGSSDTWLLTKRKNNMPTVLYDQGYDVWLLNQRGNVYSKNHISQSSDASNEEYWNFSFHEIGLYDLSATIDHVLNVTGQSDLLYVGHSMGTSALFVLCSEIPEYNKKVRAAALLAPIAYSLEASKLPVIGLVINQASFFANLLYRVNMYELLPFDEQRIKITYNLCSARVTICSAVLKFLFRTNLNNLISDEIPHYIARISSGTSVKNFEHLGNILAPGRNFTKFDYGPERNAMYYGRPAAPLYSISRVTVPLALFHSMADPFLDRSSIAELKANVPNVVLDLKISDPAFQHMDYLFGINARKLVTDYVLKTFKQFDKNGESLTYDIPVKEEKKRIVKYVRRPILYKLIGRLGYLKE